MKKIFNIMLITFFLSLNVASAAVIEYVDHIECYYGNTNYPYVDYGNHFGTIIDVTSAIREPSSNYYFDYIKVTKFLVDFSTGKHEFEGWLVFKVNLTDGRLYFNNNNNSDWLEIHPADRLLGRLMTKAYYRCHDKIIHKDT